MQFDLSEEQKMLQDSLAGCFAALNGDEALVGKYGADAALDAELWRAQRELGLAGVMVPESRGGLGMDLLTLAVVAETASAYAVATPLEYHCLAAWAIARSGPRALAEKWLAPLLEGEKVVTLAFSEAGSASSPERWSLDPGAALRGDKRFVPFAGDADLALLGLRGGQLALVELARGGVAIEAVAPLDRSRPVYHLHLDGAPAEPLGGALGARLYDAVLILHAASAFGAAKRCLDMAVEYAKVREQFGRPIGKFQALKHQLATMALELEPARYLCWYAAHCWDLEADDARQMAALCKAHLGEVAVRTARAAVEAHGGIGFTWEYPLHIWLKRAMADSAMYGTPARQRARGARLAAW